MDIPAWMFDRANCAIMIKHEVPHVTVSTLCGLGELLRSSVPQAVFKQVEQEQVPLQPKGDAHDEQSEMQTESRPARSVRRKTESPNMERSTKPHTKASKRSRRSDSC
jgi:hypothetical protein